MTLEKGDAVQPHRSESVLSSNLATASRSESLSDNRTLVSASALQRTATDSAAVQNGSLPPMPEFFDSSAKQPAKSPAIDGQFADASLKSSSGVNQGFLTGQFPETPLKSSSGVNQGFLTGQFAETTTKSSDGVNAGLLTGQFAPPNETPAGVKPPIDAQWNEPASPTSGRDK
jgi:hypothetical protein